MNPPNPLPHPRALAHLGDAIYELWIREAAIILHEKTHDLHRYTTRRVNAEIQGKILEELLPELSEEEKALVKRGQNMPVTSSRRSNQSSHRKASAFEALIGYWYWVTPELLPQRKAEILTLVEKIFSAETPAI